MKAVPSLFEHSDKNVRAEVIYTVILYSVVPVIWCCSQAKSLAIELYKWVGAAIKPTLEKSLKPVQVSTNRQALVIGETNIH